MVADYISQEEIDKLTIFMDQLDSERASSEGGGLFNLSGIVTKPHLGRIYPEKKTASNILGFSHLPNIGYFGVEEQYNDILSRPRETILVPVNPLLAEQQTDLPAGSSLILTIDRAVQKSMEELVDEAVVETGSDSATIVVINPKNGEILALATTPRMDLNDFNGCVLEIEGLEDLTGDQAYELTDASAERSAAACVITLKEERVAEYLKSNVALM